MRIPLGVVAAVILSGSVGGASAIQAPDLDEWYGLRLGAIASAARAPLPQPWGIALVAADEKGRICAVIFQDSGIEIMSDTPPGYVPKRLKSKETLAADARAVIEQMVSRLGPANEDSLKDGGRMLEWHLEERGAVLRSALLYLSSDQIYLRLNPPVVPEETMRAPDDPPPAVYTEGDCRASTPES